MGSQLLVIISIAVAGGTVAGLFVALNVFSALLTSREDQLAEVLEKVGTEEFDKPTVTAADKRSELPQKAAPTAAATPAADTAGAPQAAAAGHAHAAAAADKPAGSGHANDGNLEKVSKVWIDPGCIVCDACVNTCPEVFVITGETCIILPNADLSKVQEIKDAAAGCPVDVIKYS